MKANSSISSSEFIRGGWYKAVLFSLLLAALVAGVGGLLSLRYGREAPDVPWRNHDGKFDMVILGSSQAQYGYDPLVFGDETGMSVWNLGGAGLAPPATYYLFKDFLTVHTPEVVVLDVYWRTLEGEEDLTQLERALERIRDPLVHDEFFREGFPVGQKIEYSIPLLRYRDNLRRDMLLLTGSLLDRKSSSPAGDTSGDSAEPMEASGPTDWHGHRHSLAVVDDAVRGPRNKFRTALPSKFNPAKTEYMGRIIGLCRERGIRILVASAPILPESLALVPDYPSIHDRLQTLCDSLGVEYVDGNLANLQDHMVDARHFTDENHMNGAGADIYSAWLTRKMQAMGMVPGRDSGLTD